MKRLVSYIEIFSKENTFLFDFVTDVEIRTSRETFTDSATIVLPNNITEKKRQGLDLSFITDNLNINDRVTVSLGYFPNLITRFEGYISKISPDSPLTIECEDESFQYKQIALERQTIPNCTIGKMVDTLKPFMDKQTPNNLTTNISDEIRSAKIGDLRIPKYATFINVLDYIRNTFGLFSYWQDGDLVIGREVTDNGENLSYDFQRNIIDDNLDFQKMGEPNDPNGTTYLKAVAYGKSTRRDGTIKEWWAYYDGNEIKTTNLQAPPGIINTFNWGFEMDDETMKTLLKRRLPNLYWTGVRGSFTTFGEPIIKHGQNAVLRDLRFPEKNGTYKCKAVNIKFGMSGYRQEIEIAEKVG